MLCVALGSLRGWQVYYGMSGKFAVESVAALPWNERQLSHGISGNFRMESVATFAWNRWQLSHGIGGNFRLESVATFAWNPCQLSRGIRSATLEPTPIRWSCMTGQDRRKQGVTAHCYE